MLVCLALTEALAQVQADRFEGTYLHRSRGQDYFRAKFARETHDDGSTTYSAQYSDRVYSLLVDAKGRPVKYGSTYQGGPGEFIFAPGEVNWKFTSQDKPRQEHRATPTAEALPDFNSRPDPYLTENLVLRAYDFAVGGKQDFVVYDIDSTGNGIREYRLVIEQVDEDGVLLPTGKFKARHLVQLRETGGGTWYKEGPGSWTDVWVNDDLLILRIYRHREPYELVLQDYDRPDELIAADLTAQGYQPPGRAAALAAPPEEIAAPEAVRPSDALAAA